MSRPRYLFKFKPINTAIDLCRLGQTLHENCVFIPNITMLNDPLESMTYKISLGVAGGGYTSSHGHEHPIVAAAKEQYRILSLSANIHSPLMWAHYANNYTGICLIFSSERSFAGAKQVQYTNRAKYLDEGDFEELDDVAYESLFEKMKDWSYEKEWRLVEKAEPGLFYFDQKELVGVVVGHNMQLEIRNLIRSMCSERSIPCFATEILHYDSQIIFYPADMDNPGFEFEYLRDEVKDGYSKNTNRMFRILNQKQINKWKSY